MKSELLTTVETEAFEALADAWNKFLKLEIYHPDDYENFRHHIHYAQRIIMARPVLRQFKNIPA